MNVRIEYLKIRLSLWWILRKNRLLKIKTKKLELETAKHDLRVLNLQKKLIELSLVISEAERLLEIKDIMAV